MTVEKRSSVPGIAVPIGDASLVIPISDASLSESNGDVTDLTSERLLASTTYQIRYNGHYSTDETDQATQGSSHTRAAK